MVGSIIVRCGNGREKKRPPLFDKTAVAFARSADIKKRCQTIHRANRRQIAEGIKTSPQIAWDISKAVTGGLRRAYASISINSAKNQETLNLGIRSLK